MTKSHNESGAVADGMMKAIIDFQYNARSERIREGLIRKRARDGKLDMDEADLAILARVDALHAEGVGPSAIAQLSIGEGVSWRGGAPINKGQIWRIIRAQRRAA